MENISNIIIAITGILSVCFACYAVIYVKVDERVKKIYKEKFFFLLIEGLKNSTILNVNDISNLYKGTVKKYMENSYHKRVLNIWLREFWVNLVSMNTKEELSVEYTNKWKIIIEDCIENNKKSLPYSDLPDTDRTLFTDLESFIDKADIHSAKRKINEITSIVKKYNETTIKFEKRLKYSNLVTLFSIALTVAFGLASLLPK